jgi:hypothetical protein
VQDSQQILKGVVSFIILIKLPRHVSAANCHLQGLLKLGVASRIGIHGSWPQQANHNPYPPEAQTKLE